MEEAVAETTKIAKGAKVTGILKGGGLLEISGRFEGELHWAGEVRVTPGGELKAEGEAEALENAGWVEGTLHLQKVARLRRTGTWQGSGEFGALEVEEGAVLEGSFHVRAEA